MPRERRRTATRRRRTRLGRRLVSPRLFRRRHAARLEPETTNARSIRSSSRGPCLPASAIGSGGQAMAAVNAKLVRATGAADPAVHAAVRQGPACSLDTSRATCPVFARTAVSTRTPRPGWCMRRAAGAGPTGASSSTCSTPSAHRRRRRRRIATASSPTSWRATFTASPPRGPRRLDLVYWLGRLAVGAAPRIDSRLPASWRSPDSASCVPKEWKSFEITFQYKSSSYHIAVANNGGSIAEVAVDGRPAAGEVALENDGRRHEIRVVLS